MALYKMHRSPSPNMTPGKERTGRMKTLGEIVKSPEEGTSTLGVVLDATGYYKTDESYDYITKVRIIDKTHSAVKPALAKFEPFVTIFIFSERQEQTPVIRRVGDILYLKNVKFTTYQSIVKGKVSKKDSVWAIFDGRPNTNSDFFCCSSTKISLTTEEKNAINVLRDWSSYFFVNHRLDGLGTYRFDLPAFQATDQPMLIKDVDIIVKVVGVVEVLYDSKRYLKLAFKDAAKTLYFSEYSEGNLGIEQGMCVKLRSVSIARSKDLNQINFFNYSSILQIPDQFKDAAEMKKSLDDAFFDSKILQEKFIEEFHFEKYKKKLISHNTYVFEAEGKTSQAQVMESFPILRDFYFTQNPRSKGIQGSFIRLEKTSLRVFELSELSEILKNAQNDKNHTKHLNEFFRVKVKIAKIDNLSLKKMAQVYLSNEKRPIELGKAKETELRRSDAFILFHNVFHLTDSSLGAHSMPVYLFTSDRNPSYFFDVWKMLPECVNMLQWTCLSPKLIADFDQRLSDLVTKKREFEMVLHFEHQEEQNLYYFRIVDTILGFFD